MFLCIFCFVLFFMGGGGVCVRVVDTKYSFHN